MTRMLTYVVLLKWPGYQHLCWSTTLCLFDIYDQPLSNRDLVKSICEIYRRYLQVSTVL